MLLQLRKKKKNSFPTIFLYLPTKDKTSIRITRNVNSWRENSWCSLLKSAAVEKKKEKRKERKKQKGGGKWGKRQTRCQGGGSGSSSSSSYPETIINHQERDNRIAQPTGEQLSLRSALNVHVTRCSCVFWNTLPLPPFGQTYRNRDFYQMTISRGQLERLKLKFYLKFCQFFNSIVVCMYIYYM